MRCGEKATRAPPELSPHGDGRRTGMKGRGVPGGQKDRRRDHRLSLRHPDRPRITLGNRADIRCRLTGPRAEGGMGVGAGVLVMTSRRRGMGEGTARRHKRERHIHPEDSKCEASDSGVGGPSVHGLRVLTCSIYYAVPQKLSTDACSRLLQNVGRALFSMASPQPWAER